MASLQGKVAVVTGAGGGIGEAAAALMADRGAKVVLGDINLPAAEAVAERIRTAGGEALAVKMDLAHEEEIAAMIEAAVRTYGRLDILHNNAADLAPDMSPAFDRDVETTPTYVWDRCLMVNVRGTALACKFALPPMVNGGGGSIINTASNLALQGHVVQVAYAASKAAVIQMTRSIAASHGRRGVRANAVLPGLTLTQSVRDNIPPAHLQAVMAETLTPFLAEAQDIAFAVAFLASDEARNITGQCLVSDGGTASHVPGFSLVAGHG
jgi:NAD(P)-dependent dehydrogenase (short-subunit alcohol dehydrogenase family)